jgi:CubicO group peptidase (beta-lactamase class C family)
MAELPMLSAYSGRTLAVMADKYSRVNVLFSPGSRWQYSQTSINTAARIVEVVSGLSFDQSVDTNICQPLGMLDTTFYLSESQASRLAQAYAKTDEGLKPATIFVIPGVSPTSRDRFPAANGGLFSTASDYIRFCQMLLGKGQCSGKRLLSSSAVTQMRTIATGEMKTGFTEGNGWGIGCCVVVQPQGVTASLSPGSFGHGGAYGTQAWIDPVKNRIYLLLVQRSNFANADASPLRQAFQDAAQTDTSRP